MKKAGGMTMRSILPSLFLIALSPFSARAGTQDEAAVRAQVGKITTAGTPTT